MITRGVRSAILAAAVLAPAWALAETPLTPPPATAPATEGGLTHESLKTKLEGLGYEFQVETSTAETPIYTLDFQQGTFRYVIRVALTTDCKTLFLDAPLRTVPTTEPVPVERMIRILEENSKITPTAFRYAKAENRLYLTRGIENKDITTARLRKIVGDFMQVMSDSQPLWNPAKWEPLPTAVPAAPAVSTVDPASDLGRMQGKWTVKAITHFGRQLTDEQVRQIATLTVVDRTMTSMDTKFTIEVDAAAKTINVINSAGQRELGIYRIDGSQLTFHLAKTGEPRPADYTGNANTTLFTLEAQTAPAGVASTK